MDISNSLLEFVDKLDNEEAPAKEEKGIKVLYLGVSKDNQFRIVIIEQAETVAISNHIQKNIVRFDENVALIHTAVVSSYNKS